MCQPIEGIGSRGCNQHLEQNISHVKCPQGLPEIPGVDCTGGCHGVSTQAAERLRGDVAALFTMTNSWKQPKCPLTDEWINWGLAMQCNIIQS